MSITSLVKNCVICTAMVNTLLFQNVVYAAPILKETKWESIDMSLTELLNSGWQISGHGSNRIAFRNNTGPGGKDEETFTFLLTKNGKHIFCFVVDPVPPKASTSGCRRLN
jgi:hypothetical protein